MISNPATFFVDGNTELSFKYEGGNVLYHFSAKDSGLSTYNDMNIIFFANDKDHARDILSRMLSFKLGCLITYRNQDPHKNSIETATRIDKVTEYLERISEWKFTLTPRNQMFIVGWAANDTI